MNQIESASLDTIKKYVLGKDTMLPYEFELVRRVSSKDDKDPIVPPARNFFLGEFSEPFLDYIATEICEEESSAQIKGEYYEFISKKDVHTLTPYYKLTLFKGNKNASLQSYVSTITTRYFCSVAQKDNKIRIKSIRIDSEDGVKPNFVGSDVIENMWFQTLIHRDDDTSCDEELNRSVMEAMSLLPEREQLVLKLMVMGDASGLEAFEDLEPYIAETSKTPTYTWSIKQKQDAMSLLKTRALVHLKKIIAK